MSMYEKNKNYGLTVYEHYFFGEIKLIIVKRD